jgi:hypothetical protein
MELSEAFHASRSFNDFFTIKHPKWYEPQVSMDKKVKVPRENVLDSNYFDAYKIEDDGTTTPSTPLVLSYDAHNNSTHYG